MSSEHEARDLRSVPLVGQIACGDWQEAVEAAEETVPAVVKGAHVFALKAVGDSMNELIQEDGYIYVNPDDRDLIDGKVYVIMNGEGETTAKRFRGNPARLVPCSTNPKHQEIVIGSGNFTVIGRVVGSYSPL